MRIYYGFSKLKFVGGAVVALGVFDGMHFAHRHIIDQAVRAARRLGVASVVVTFWPHPQKKESLYSLEHRLRLIEELGVEACIVIRFSKYFSSMHAVSFARRILVEKIGASHVYVGKNFHFGKKAQGDWRLLKKLGSLFGFQVRIFDVIRRNKKAVSSTVIRRLIVSGRLQEAKKLLLRPVSILGTVTKGTALGRLLGFPTANLNPHHEILPPVGIYAVKVRLGPELLKGICYIGRRPTFEVSHDLSIEVHIFNFHRTIYGRDLEVLFMKRIRKDKKFTSKEALIQQIKRDIHAVQSIL